MRQLPPHTCPRCLGGIPNNEHRGAYPGALSRTDNTTEICSECGLFEAIESWEGHLTDQSKWGATNLFFAREFTK